MEQRRLASTEWVDIVNEENEVIAQASREPNAGTVSASSCNLHRRA